MECVVTIQVFVSSGLGGMSGAQPKAAAICGCIGVVAEVGPYLLYKYHMTKSIFQLE